MQKWDHLKHLRYSVAVGTAEERIAALKADADIYIINRENVDWLVSNTKFDYDMIVIDDDYVNKSVKYYWQKII